MEEYLSCLHGRVRWFGERTYAEPRHLSKGCTNAQYRSLSRFFNWLAQRKYVGENPLSDIEPPGLEDKTVPTVPEDLLTLPAPALAKTPAHRFRLARDRAILYVFRDTPGRLSETAKLRLGDTDLKNGTLLVVGKGRIGEKRPLATRRGT